MEREGMERTHSTRNSPVTPQGLCKPVSRGLIIVGFTTPFRSCFLGLLVVFILQ